MPICNKCNQKFPNRIKINGIAKVICSRKYCLDCSPFKQHNTRKLEKYGAILDDDKKYCSDCKKGLPLTEFYKRKNGSCYSCCKICQSRKTNKQRETKLKCINYKGGKCQRCGYNRCIQALDFHHMGDKKFGISTARNKRFEKLKLELDKCILVCAICHRELHAGLWLVKDLRL